LLKFINGNPVPQSQRLHAEGTLQALECLGTQAKIHVLSGGGRHTFLIADPTKVQMTKPEGLEFICGDQKGEPVLVEYTVNTDASLNAEGIVRSLEIKGK